LFGLIHKEPKIDHDFICSAFTRKITGKLVEYDTKKYPLCTEGEKAVQELLEGWVVYRIYSEKESSYFGVLYYHKDNKQLVLAHRSTHSDMAKTHEMF
jgi:hypothetical protein